MWPRNGESVLSPENVSKIPHQHRLRMLSHTFLFSAPYVRRNTLLRWRNMLSPTETVGVGAQVSF